MIHLLRASHANEFELQNYVGIAQKLGITIISSHHPLTPISLPHQELWSPTDLPIFLFRRQLLNRAIGGEQWLLGLEKLFLHERNHVLIHDYTIIHTAETYTPYTHQAVKLRKRGLINKLVCTCWETIPHANEKFARLRKWKREAYQYIDLFHTPTLRAKQALVSEGVDPAKITLIPYGVDLSKFKPSKTQAKHHKPVVIMVARPVREKGIEIFRVLASDLRNIADFRLVSHTHYAAMPAIYRSADIFFLPSQTTPTWEEQYGMSLIEAMASGLPIVTTESGAIPEVVGGAGLLSDPTDFTHLKSDLTRLISSSVMRAKYADLSLARASKLYDSRKVAMQLAQLYC